ncbi:hypothetical protein CIG75_01150 [Tumebacillus algifaecis]|uniref:Uncharacterized protein n=1 Tax=Tumebacillus algifaecis TaxID=1214604 RepID=A0A223CWN2_9BACL|nr:hypothetical protein [Tumebacillus algifaecis]ASS73720.1 hypothetical protein CIG75_01150 [Tumebacillus algifaecis]
MRFEITVDESFLQDLFLINPTDDKQLNRINRLRRHILVGSKELGREWEKLEQSHVFQNNPTVRQVFREWLTNLVQSPRTYKSVKLPVSSKVQGEPSEKERTVLGTAYESKDKIVVGDYPDELRRANPDLKFVPKDDFSKEHSVSITLRDVQLALDGAGNLKKKWFAIFETPIELQVPENGDADVLARYLAYFYDNKLVIQDKYFVADDQNEANFVEYVLAKLPEHQNCEIELRVMVNEQLRRKGTEKKNKYEGLAGSKITVRCIQEGRENLHEGYIESGAFRMQVPYRLKVFGRDKKTEVCTIQIRRKE